MKALTKAEESIMQVLWHIEKGFVKDIIHELPLPKPKYSTVSTIVRILEDKGFVGHKAYGKSHQYHPLVDKEDYARVSLGKLAQDYFGNSFKKLVHCLSQQEDLSLQEVDAVIHMLKEVSQNRRAET